MKSVRYSRIKETQNHHYGYGSTESTQSYMSSNDDEEFGCSATSASKQDDTGSSTLHIAVFRLKLALLVLLISSAVGIASFVYSYASHAEIARFEDRFVSEATKVVEAVGSTLDRSLSAVDTYTVTLTSWARSTNQTFPFVTIPNHSVLASKVCGLSGVCFAFNQYHLVTADQRTQWEEYTLKNDEWVAEAAELARKDPSYSGKTFAKYEPVPGIRNEFVEPIEGPGPFLPMWQSYPLVPESYFPAYNIDLSSYFAFEPILPYVLESKRVVVGKVPNLVDPGDPLTVEIADEINDVAKDFIREDRDPSEPIVEIYYPIVNGTMNPVRSTGSGTVVGVAVLTSYWRSFVENILPPGSDGVVCVFENCEQSFTYEIHGADVEYIGPGDLHDSNYDCIGISSNVLHIGKHSSGYGGSIYTGVQISEDFCPYSLHVYPSRIMEEEFRTANPDIFAMVTLLIFVISSVVFIAYDRLVTRKLEETNKHLEAANRRVVLASERQLQHFASMSHEIRTPLNCITGISSLLLSETDLNPKQEESIRMIVSSSDLLLTVVNDVLDFSKLESGNFDIEIKRRNLQDTLSSVVHSIEAKGQTKNLSVITFYDVAVPEFINTDTRRLQQILYNLLGNSIKFSKEGGTVELHVLLHRRSSNGCHPSAYQIKQSLRVESTVVRFVVKDYGKGIARQDFQKIFKPFRQAGEDEEVYGGTGLGLAIAADLVRHLGGSISVDSEEGKWSAFTVDLPFDGDPVIVGDVAPKLRDALVFLVGKAGEDLEQVLDTFRYYKVAFDKFETMDDLKKRKITSGDFPFRHRIEVYLIHEDMFVNDIYDSLSIGANTILLSFGPKYGVKEAQGHFRSLVQLLPSVLMKLISKYVSQSDRQVPKEMGVTKDVGSLEVEAYRDLRILIAEDNVVNQKVLSRLLKRLGVQHLEIVDNGKKAVEREASKEFNLVLMDMQMPVMDGVEACRRIHRRAGGHHSAKVIFVTAHVAESFEAECRKAGAVGFLAKPCKLDSVKDCLRRFVGDR